MSRSFASLRAAALAAMTAGSLAFGVSQALAVPAAPSAARRCYDCSTYCKALYGPESVGVCTRHGCICTPTPEEG